MGAAGCTLTIGAARWAVALLCELPWCELPQKRHSNSHRGNSHSTPADFKKWMHTICISNLYILTKMITNNAWNGFPTSALRITSNQQYQQLHKSGTLVCQCTKHKQFGMIFYAHPSALSLKTTPSGQFDIWFGGSTSMTFPQNNTWTTLSVFLESLFCVLSSC